MYLVDYLGTKVILYPQSYKRIFVHLTFYDCSGLTSIEIPNSVTSIGNYAFYKCLQNSWHETTLPSGMR